MKAVFHYLTLLALAALLTGCTSYLNMDPDDFEEASRSAKARIVDVRTPEEFTEGHLPRAVNCDLKAEDFLQQMEAAFDKTEPLYVYCRSGRRSAEAAKALTKAGYEVCNMTGGIEGWKAEGKPVTKYEVERFISIQAHPVDITLIKHGTLAIAYKDITIQIDPVTKLGKETDYANEFPKADFILVTHEHGDHLDPSAIEALTDDETILLLNPRSRDQLGRGEAIMNGEKRQLAKDILLEAVPAYNTTPGRENFHPKGNGNGYVLTIDGLRIYIAGDTEDIPEMAELKDIDVAFLPVNQPYTMTVEQCVNAARIIGPRVLIPYHFGQTDLSAVPSLLPGIDVRLRQLQ
jgi:L-ascorbate metabolism protein UlaG (beta-lactamase superfamily)/rhodanese-related sulfurtransferase